jgi:hypothetical protein
MMLSFAVRCARREAGRTEIFTIVRAHGVQAHSICYE